MINRFFLAIAKRLRPDLGSMSGLDLIGSLVDLVALIYITPFAVVGVAWLIAVTDLTVVRQEWLLLLLLLLIGVVFKQLDFTLRLEIKPGVFSLATGSFETLIFWSAALLFGFTALWAAVIAAIVNFKWQQVVGKRLRWYRWRKLFTDVASMTLAGLVALLIYDRLGGEVPFPGIMVGRSLAPVAVATLVWFIIPRLLVSPLLMYVSRSPELVGSGSLTDQASLTRFLLVGASISGVADPFAVLAAGLYAQQGIVVYLFFVGGVVLAGWLANRLSYAVTRSEGRARELEVLERLGRAIITAPAERSALSDILVEYVPGLFAGDHMEIQLFPDEVLFRHPLDTIPMERAVWEQLQAEPAGYCFMPGVVVAEQNMDFVWDGLAVAIVKGDTAEFLGGICVLLRRDVGRIANILPAVQTLAAQIASALQRIEVYQQVLEEQAEVYQAEVYAQAYQAEVYAQALALEKAMQELALAGQIQASFLPEDSPDVPGWQMAVALEPAREASGDFYDFIELPNGRLGLLVADVADKGMGAALYMALSRTLIRTYAVEHDTAPEKVLAAANRRILADTHNDLFVTVFYAVLDLLTGVVIYCNAGHNPPFLLQSQNGNETLSLTRTAMPLGIFEEVDWQKSAVQMMPGDILMLYTDGVTEAQDEDEGFFGEGRLKTIMRANLGRSAAVIEDKVISAVYDFAGDAPQFDDITLMVVIRETVNGNQ